MTNFLCIRTIKPKALSFKIGLLIQNWTLITADTFHTKNAFSAFSSPYQMMGLTPEEYCIAKLNI